MNYIEYQNINSYIPYNFNAFIYRNYLGFTHLHADYELLYVMKGTLELSSGSFQGRFVQGEAALILPNQIHNFSLGSHSLVWIGVFAKEYVPEFHKLLQGKICPNCRIHLEDYDRKILQKKLICCSPDEADSKTVLPDGRIICEYPPHLALCATLNLACAAYMKTRNETDFQKNNLFGNERLIHQILTYVQNHYTEDITLRQVAQSLGYDEHYISRCFNDFFDKNFKQFVNENRIHHARNLLVTHDPNISMIDIAYQSGFQSVRNFNKVYRDIMGCPPGKSIE